MLRRIASMTTAVLISSTLMGQRVLSLDSCESLALQNNKEQQISNEEVKQAEYEKKAAFALYFPDISLKAAYLRNQKELSLISEDLFLPIGTVTESGFGFDKTPVTPNGDGTFTLGSQVSNKWKPILDENGQVKTMVPLDAQGNAFDPTQNPEKLQWKEYTTIPKDEMEFDTRNVFVCALNLTQPLFMGGKIVAYNKLSDLKRELAESKNTTNKEEILVKVDEAYWRTVSLYNKLKAVNSLIGLLDTMSYNVDVLIQEGVATKKDALTIAVKRNEAKMTKVRIENGINLYKMQLAQYCGIPSDEPYELADKDLDNIPVNEVPLPNMEEVYQNRSELKSLTLAKEIYDQKAKVVRADMLPTLALTANYFGTNPNMYNGFENKMGWQWNVGVVLNVPLFHMGERYYKYQAAKSEAAVQELKLGDTQEKVNLQVNQYSYKQTEALRKLGVAEDNLREAEENLRMAQISYNEGVVTTSDLLGAQTAWLGATSDKIDAEIDAKINGLYLLKSSGNLGK